MRQDVKEWWTTALRSGEYEQGQGTLTYTMADGKRKHCCLGVLCEELVKRGVLHVTVQIIPHTTRKTSRATSYTTYDRAGCLLPTSVVRFAELQSDDPKVRDPREYVEEVSLAFLNDHDASFDVIADAIEASL